MYKKLWKTALISSAIAVGLGSAAFAQAADDYPNRNVKLIVAAAAGSSPDSVGRLLANELSQRWGHPVVIENSVGLGGIIGAEKAAKQPNDGYNLVLSTSGAMAVGGSMMELSYDPVKDFEPISLVMSMPNLLVVHPSVPVKTLPELVAYVKENPGKLRYGHPGLGTTPHLSAELLKDQTGIEMMGIPYKASSQMATDLLAGHYEVLFHNSSVMMPHVEAGTAVALGVTSAERMPAMPNVPTVAEAGDLNGFEVNAWFGVYAPAGTPKEIVMKINKDMNEILSKPETLQWLEERNGRPGGGTPEDLAKHQANETTKWRALIEKAGIKPN